VADKDKELAEKTTKELAELIWSLRRELKPDYLAVEPAVAAALAAKEGPVILADQSDNPGGGSTCDGTHILRAMLEKGIKDAAVALIIDPAAVAACHAAGVGATVELSLGGKARPDLLGAPLECTAYVRLLSDGRYINRGQINGGILVDLKKSAVVLIDGIQVIIGSNVTQPYDLEIFYAHGIDPARQKVLLVKSTIHFRAAFEPIASQIINVAAPGLLIMDPAQVDYKRSRRPIYPLDDI
jgi:microcystin degradation protein MlrC